MIGVGVIGLGFMGQTHVRAWEAAHSDGIACRLVAVADQDPERLTGHVASAGNIDTGQNEALFDPHEVATYTDVESLLRDDAVHAVSVCTHTDTHVDLAIAGLEAGKHVLVEKPVAVKTDCVSKLADVVRAHPQLVCMPAMCMRFWPAWSWIADRVRDGSFGAARSAAFQRLGSAPTWSEFYKDPERSGGALGDLHIHDTDFIVHLFGPPDAVVSAGHLNHLTTHYRYADGPAHVVAEGAWDHTPGFGFRMRCVVVFERATAEFELGRNQELMLSRDGECELVDVGGLSGYDGEVRAFRSAIAGDLAGVPTIDDAVVVSRVLDAERESCRTGLVVSPAVGIS